MEVLQQFPMQLEDDIEWGKKILEQRTKLTADDIAERELFEKATIMDAPAAFDCGLIHGVMERKIPPGIMTWNIA